MSPNNAPKLLSQPLPATPRRTTSQVSVISVEARNDQSLKLLSRSTPAGPSTSPSIKTFSSDEVQGRVSAASSIRKGKGRMLEQDDHVSVESVVEGQRGEEGRPNLRDMVASTSVPAIVNGVVKTEGLSARRYYVLSNAGKPVFSTVMGVAQALISIFAEEDDRIRSIIKGKTRISFLLKAPLYLFCVSDWGEPEHVLRMHLEYIHLYILSVVTSSQLSRIFQRRSNFDLTRLLEGTEAYLHRLISRCQEDFSFFTSTLQPLRMPPSLRETAAAALMPPSKFQDLLYVLLIAGNNIVTLLRPRKHSIHPSDLHLLLNMLSSPTLRSSEAWIPMCLPKFNPAGFVHAYVSFEEDVGLVFVNADKEAFEGLRQWKEAVVEKLDLKKIQQAIPQHPYDISALACPDLLHFIYKSRPFVQITSPEWTTPYDDESNRRRIITTYQKLHDMTHAKSGQKEPLKLAVLENEQETCLAWITKPFELYITSKPGISKSALVSAANIVARWVTAEEARIFLKDAPVF